MTPTNPKPTIEGMAPPAVSAQARKPAAAPVFKPEFARSLRMHPIAAAVAGLLAFVLILAFALSQKPVYEAETLVYIEPTSAKLIADSGSGLFDSAKYDSLLAQQMQTAQRLDIVTAAIRSLPKGTWQAPGESEQEAAARLQNSVKTQRVATSYQISFTLRGSDPAKTAATLNAVVDAYLRAGKQQQSSLAEERAQILGEEKQRIGDELNIARAEQARLSTSLGMASPGMDVGNPYDTQLVGLRTELAAARQSHDVAAAQLASVSGADQQRASGLSAAAEEIIAGDSGLSSMKSTISQRRATLSSQMAGLTPENPIYKQDQEEMADLDRSLDAMSTQLRDKAARRLQDKLRTELSRTGDIESRLNAQLAQQTAAATSASPRLQRATELTADIARLMKRYADVDDALRSLQLETTGPGSIRLALAATPPVTPLPSRKRLLILLALPLALMVGAFAAVLMRKRDHRIYSGRDVEDVLGFSPIAVLPATLDVSPSVMQEYILRLAGGVESAYRGSGARTFVLTSAGPSTDVHGLTASLSQRMQQLGLDVTTVTAAQILSADFRPAEPAGQDEAAVTLSTSRFEGVAPSNLTHIKSFHDVVLIDSPALLTSAETEYMVRCADATILVACSGVTLRGELLQSALLLERLNVRGIAAVLDGLELRYANASFRKAISDLDRRHVEAPFARAPLAQETRPVAQEAFPAAEVAVQPNVAEAPIPSDPLPISATETEELPVAAEPISEAAVLPQPVAPELVVPEPVVFESPALVNRPIVSEPEPEQSRTWFKRLFRPGPQLSMSIIPTDDDDEEEAEITPLPATSSELSSTPAALIEETPQDPVPVAEIVEAPLPVAAEPVFAPTPPEMPEAPAETVAEPVASTLPPVTLPAPPPSESAPEPAVFIPAAFHLAPAPEPVAEAPEEEPVRRPQPAPEPLPVAAEIRPLLRRELDLPLAVEPGELRTQPVAPPEIRRPAADAWQPIPPLRGEQMPWRSYSGSREVAPALAYEARPAEPVRAPRPSPQLPDVAAPRPILHAGPELVSREPRLTRQWGLLSRFEQTEAKVADHDELNEPGEMDELDRLVAAHAVRTYRRS